MTTLSKKILQVSWESINNKIEDKIDDLLEEHDSLPFKYVYGVPRGGIPISIIFAEKTGLTILESLKGFSAKQVLVVDDILDSGKTRERYKDYTFITLYEAKPGIWLEFPWERMSNEAPAEDAVIRLIESIGEDPEREGLKETPQRVIKSYSHLFSGYDKRPEDVIKIFYENYDEIVLLKNIELYSMCEHHMLPFIGKCHIAYLPNGKVIGISKLARIMEIYARRLQIQERLTIQIVDVLMRLLEPLGAACIIEAEHLCMRMRGIEKQNSTMVTSCMKGVFLNNQNGCKDELLSKIYGYR